MRWRIYYSDRVIDGDGEAEWQAAPDQDVQVVVSFQTPPKHAPIPTPQTTGYVHCGLSDRMFYTGVDTYNPFGYGTKYGRLIPDAAYQEIWARAYAAS